MSESESPSRPALADRLFQAALGTLDLYTIYVGDQLGLYRALSESGPITSSELAARTGTTERYVREWLEQQAVTGIVDVEGAGAEASARRYSLPPNHADVLVDPDSLNYEAHKAIEVVRASRQLPQLVEAFRTAGGLPPLPWEPEGRAEFNRARFLKLLGNEWIASVADLDSRLRSDPPATVADIGCGTGWASIAIALAYPKVRVDGFDLDEMAIAKARSNAMEAGVAAQVDFHVQDAADPSLSGRYDVAVILEALHDMSRPVEALRVARGLLTEGGSVFVADERVGERFTVPTDERERYVYGWSVVTCLPSAMEDPESAQTGAVMRPSTLRGYAEEAGFTDVQILPIEDESWRFYRLIP